LLGACRTSPNGRDASFVLSEQPSPVAGGRAAVGASRIRWNAPTSGQATIDRLEWDPALGGSEEVRQVIDSLVGDWRAKRGRVRE